MNGKVLVIGLLGISAVAGAGLWYTTNHLYYDEVTGVETVSIQGDAWPVSDYRGIDADSSPLKLRACFTVGWDFVAVDTHKDAVDPLRAPYWFDCFDAEAIAKDIAADAATVHLAEHNQPFGFSSYIAQYPDGQAYLWRQMNACGKAQAEGEEMPEGCGQEVAPAALEAPDVSFELQLAGEGGFEAIKAENLQAVIAGTGVNALWACFETAGGLASLKKAYRGAAQAEPSASPVTLPCFDADRIAADLETGAALAFKSTGDVAPGFDRMIAIYDDGRAFAWHQRME